MKQIIKVKKINKNSTIPSIITKGDWVDLKSADNIIMTAPQAKTLQRHKINGVEVSHRDVEFDFALIPLGVAMKLPKGFEAVIVPRSSTFRNYGIIEANSQGVIDSSYCGDNDEWKFPAISLRDTIIEVGDRICQFRVQLSQKATMWQKLKWMLSSGIKFVEVQSLDNNDRGGFGSTGVK